MEPELTVSTIPNAHAVLFLLSIDTGVTKSDLEIWDRYVKTGLPQKVAVLNKVDLMWDELKTPAEIEKAIARMVETTAQHLQLPKERIFALSAQKGLLGKIREDAGLVKKSGIDLLEKIPRRRDRADEAADSLQGGGERDRRHDEFVARLGGQAPAGQPGRDRRAERARRQEPRGGAEALGQDHLGEERVQRGARRVQGEPRRVQLQARRALGHAQLPRSSTQALARSAQAIEDSWTTITLQRGMNSLVRDLSANFEAVFAASEDIKKLMQGVYNTFIEKFGFQRMTIPRSTSIRSASS